MRARRVDARFAGRRAARAGLTLASALALAGAGCGSDGVLVSGRPHGERPEEVSGEIAWSSDDPALGSVMYGESPGRYTRIAYPLGRAWEQEHRTPLLAEDGIVYHAKARAVLPSGEIVPSREFSFVSRRGRARPEILSWTMIDVGWGDAHLAVGPGGKRILIDSGRPDHVEDLVTFLMDELDPRTPFLDVVLATHEDSDHIGGLVGALDDPGDGILERFTVGRIVLNEAPESITPELAKVLEIAASDSIAVTHLREGDSDTGTEALRWGEGIGVRVLNARNLVGDGVANNGSIVLRVAFGSFRLIAGGDLEAVAEARIVDDYGGADGGSFLRADVLKVNHHGHDDASSPAYLAATSPVVALVPSGSLEVACSAPARSVLERLFALPADVYRSDFARPVRSVPCEDDYGHVTVVSDGRSFEVRIRPSAALHHPPD